MRRPQNALHCSFSRCEPSLTRIARFLTFDDIPTLLQLESRQWTSVQAASVHALNARLRTHPDLCVGVFHSRTSEALASLFMKPITHSDILRARCWDDCAADGRGSNARATNSLFGISLTSVDPHAVQALFEFFWPHALKNRWREIYLGSPAPGLKRALDSEPALDATTYVHSRRNGLPRDPQLRYYYQKGFTDIVAVLPDYFPHVESLDYGVLIRGAVPLAMHTLVWKYMPLSAIQALLGCITRLERLLARCAKTWFWRKFAW